jgi:hypothetical protein
LASAPETARFVEVPMSVQVPPRIAPKASGIKSFDGRTRARCAMPKTTGTNIAVVVVFFITEAHPAAVNMISVVSLNSLPPAMRWRRRPTRSTTPVLTSPPVSTKSPAMVMTMSLPKPANASETLSVPVSTSPMTSRMVTTSIGIFSVPKSTSATTSRMRTVATGWVIRFFRGFFCYNPATA